MKKKLLLCLLVFVGILTVAGCQGYIQNGQGMDKNDSVVANQTLGWMNFYVPTDFTYQPSLRGLIYTEDERKIFVKGDYNDRSEAIIIDAIKEETNDYFSDYIEKKNANITDVKYTLLKDNPKIYSREKYQGRSGDTVIYNYTYLAWYNSYIYSITISGPSTMEEELNNLKENVVKTLHIGNE